MMLTEKELVCPSGTPGRPPIIIDMRLVHKTEGRIQELGALTPMKAGEFMATFIETYLDTHDKMVHLTKELADAKRNSDIIRSNLTLDKAPEELKNKGLLRAGNPAGSEDLRDAIISRDPEYVESRSVIAQLEAAVAFLSGKCKSLDMVYTAAKKVYDSQSSIMNKNDPALSR